MSRETLLQNLLRVLDAAHYEVAQQLAPSSFDILARKRVIFLIKVLSSIDSLAEEHAEDLKRISSVLNATPLVIGETANNEPMHDQALYERAGIASVNFETFEEAVLEQKYPFVYAKKGGFYAHLNADFLKKAREAHKLSLAELAREAGVARSTIQNYEQGEGAEVGNVLRLQETLGDLVLDPIDLFKAYVRQVAPALATPEEQKVTKRLSDLGFQSTTVSKASFRIAGRHKDDILLTGLKKSKLEERAQDIHETSEALGQHGMFVFEHKKTSAVKGVPILEHEELKGVVTNKELLKLLKELEE